MLILITQNYIMYVHRGKSRGEGSPGINLNEIMKLETILCPSVEIFLLLKKRIPQPDPFLISMRLKRILLILLSDSWMMGTKQKKN